MIKKIVYVGIAVLVISIAVFFIFGGLVSNSISGTTSKSNMTVGAHNYTYMALSAKKQGTIYVMEEGSTQPLNLYLLSSAQLGAFESYVNASKAYSGEGFANMDNINSTDVAINATSFGPYSFYNSNTVQYLVEDNTFGIYSNTLVSSIVLFAPLSESTGLLYSIISIIILLGIIAGVVLIIYGLIKSDRSKADIAPLAPTSEDKAYVDKLYSKSASRKRNRRNAR